MTADDVARRLPVWHAFADLFLDTELQAEDYRAMARKLKASGYSPDELRQILNEEVAPAFAFNLMNVAGEWAGWNKDDVLEIMRRSRRSLRPTRWLLRRMFASYLAAEWAMILPLIETPAEQDE